MLRLTPRAVIERLRAVYGVETDDELAQAAGIKLRTLTRWKAKDTPGAMPQFDETVRLLSLAGLLAAETQPAGPQQAPAETAARLAAVELNQAEIGAQLRELADAVARLRPASNGH